MKLKINGLLNCTSTQELANFLGDRYVRTDGDNVYYKYKDNESESVWPIYKEIISGSDEILFIDAYNNLTLIHVPKGSVEIIQDLDENDCEETLSIKNIDNTIRLESLVEDKSLTDRLLDIIEIYAKKK